MKCILLSAGKGKRLMPFTKLTPKCLLSISSTNLMEYWLKKIKLIGFEEIIINTHHLSEILISEIELISKKLNINNIRIVHETSLLGTAGTLWSIKDTINSDFMVINTDVYAEINLELMIDTFNKNNQKCLLAYDYRNDTHGCGIITLLEDGFIEKFIEKKHDNKPGYVYSGILIFSNQIFTDLPFKDYIEVNYHGLDTGFHVLPKIIGNINSFKIAGKVIDLRDKYKLKELRTYFIKNNL